jgi:NADPH:quinone reductase-like Zn-dependent oxidoreductase
VEVPDPKLAQNGVLIRVKAAALNPAEHMLQAGLGNSIIDSLRRVDTTEKVARGNPT